MPPGGTCNRCKQVQPATGDTWCSGCTAWEAIGRELCGFWDQAGCRALASDLVINCARQVRALRSLGAGLSRAPGGEAGGGRASSQGRKAHLPRPPSVPREPERVDRDSLPRRRSSVAPPTEPKEEEDEEEESEEEEERVDDSPHTSGHNRRPDRRDPPPEPEGPPPGTFRSGHRDSEAGSRRAAEPRRSHRDQRSPQRDRDRTRSGRKRKHRAGSKHQRLGRLATDPFLPVHRKADKGFLELGSSSQGVDYLHHPIL